MNKIMLIGRLVRDPELRYTQSGAANCSFTLAVNRRFQNQNGEREADFINCVAWQKTGEFVAEYFKKGQMMALEGRLQLRSYNGNDGQKRWVTEVIAEQVEFTGGKNDSGGNHGGGTGNSSSGGFTSGLGQEIEFDDNDLPF